MGGVDEPLGEHRLALGGERGSEGEGEPREGGLLTLVMPPPTSPTRRAPASTAPPTSQKCSGPCGRVLPVSCFLPDRQRKSGRRSDCKECYRARRGSRGKEGQRARDLAKELWVIRETYADVPALAEILSRAYEEAQRLGATGAKFDEIVRTVRKTINEGGARTVDEIMEDTHLSRWAVDRALEKLVADNEVEPRDKYLLKDEAEESGRRPVEYHPTDTPSGEVFAALFPSRPVRRAVDDDLL